VFQAVSVGILIKDHKVLLGLRKFEEVWEFPGGSVKKGEQPEETLIREFQEELDIQIKEYELANSFCYYKYKSRIIVLFYVTKWEGEIKKNCHTDLKWFSFKECKKYKVPNINPELLNRILKILSKKIEIKVKK